MLRSVADTNDCYMYDLSFC